MTDTYPKFVKKQKPIRVFYSPLSGRFYATQHWKEKDGYIEITGKKYDVTNDIGAAVEQHNVTFSREK
ncbi:hypothetical protein KAR91_59905 [Candidatus Pacearchaeota archaeon]|nr:hypothetical protein [Candidatus Pacearchaeota archaeon]